eukprot:CAMPEP_0194712292 /NCGR_PEP_ID=MMETSP0296-20130528/4435_1 /TAXON_ID=39354 /ORGANISM="Heterosigma akashiwo, Strain CCMP2393" /LENGTH=163 /DNA_ID=CAMNT_0039610655 /DNA_START=115 /DNA_END=602 /DNA_ORIENTATION=+
MALVKVDNEGDLRVLELSEPSVNCLREQICQAYGFQISDWEDLALKYKDTDGDNISLCSDSDLQLALRLNVAPLRLTLLKVQEVETDLMKEFRASTLTCSCVDFLHERHGVLMTTEQFEIVLDMMQISLDEASTILNPQYAFQGFEAPPPSAAECAALAAAAA